MTEQQGHQGAARRETMLQELTAAMKRHHRRRRLRRTAAAWGLLGAVAGAAWIVRAQQEIRPVWPDDTQSKVEAPVPRIERITGSYRTGLVTVIDDEELVRRLASVDGDVWVPRHPYLSKLAGKSGFAHYMTLVEVIVKTAESEARSRLIEEVETAIRERRFEWILVDADWDRTNEWVQPHYEWTQSVFPEDDVFWPVTGLRVRPERIYEATKPE